MYKLVRKSHIVALSILASLFLLVFIWKQTSGTSLKEPTQESLDMDSDMLREVRFWEKYHRATTLRVDRNYEDAAVLYDQALQLNDLHRDALYYAGSVHLMLRAFDKAEQRWNRLLKIDPGSPRSLQQLGTLYFCLEESNPLYNPDRAREVFEQAWSMNREETGPPLALAKIALIELEPDRSLEYLEVVRQGNRMNYQALFLVGFIHWLREEYETAREWLSRSSVLYRTLSRLEMHGEGATERGARAMLSEDLFCDFAGSQISALLGEYTDPGSDAIYSGFARDLQLWREGPGIEAERSVSY